jgi:RND family efflux transporter MFP subunit
VASDDLLSSLSIDRKAEGAKSGKSFLLLLTVLLGASTLVLAYLLYTQQTASMSMVANPATAASAATVAAAEAGESPGSAAQQTLAARPSNDTRILDASGYVVAMRVATASSKTVGRIVEVLVEEGMQVEEGQIVALLDSETQLIQLNLARARLARSEAAQNESRARLREAELALTRAGRMAEAKLVSQEDLDNAEIRVDQINAELDRQAAEIRIAEQEILLQERIIEENIIRAPFSGVVVQKNAQPGEIIAPSTSGGGFTRTGICTIVDMSSLEIEVNVTESYINRVFVGQRAEAVLDAYPDFVSPAAVSAIVPTADRQRATIKVRVKFDELDPRILPDMGVKVAFFGE